MEMDLDFCSEEFSYQIVENWHPEQIMYGQSLSFKAEGIQAEEFLSVYIVLLRLRLKLDPF